jgi:hypothetical protein
LGKSAGGAERTAVLFGVTKETGVQEKKVFVVLLGHGPA